MHDVDGIPTALLPPSPKKSGGDELLVGQRYRIVRELGSGGMGTVYEAVDTVQDRPVALKIMSPTGGWDSIVRFHREAQIASIASTRHIVQVYGAGSDEATSRHYIAMELLTGEDLSELIDRTGPIPEHLALRIAVQACAGLSCAHRQGAIHRDIKPANLYLTRIGDEVVVKVLDFGTAKVNETIGPSLTTPGTLLGSPHYMAPEQMRGKPVDARADVWSMGVVLFKMLAAKVPFAQAKNLGALMMHIFKDPVPSVRDAAPWVRPAVAQVCDRALQKEPDARFESIDALAYALVGLVDGPAVIRRSELPEAPIGYGETMPCHASMSPDQAASQPPPS